jgi:RNA polymerase sigma-B factor
LPPATCHPSPSRVDDIELDDLLARMYAGAPGTAERRHLRERAIGAALPLAWRLAARYHRHGEPLDDLRQVAALALVQAVDGYRPGCGSGFRAYAIPTILGALRRHFRDHTWNVRVPRRLQEMRLRIMVAERDLSQRLQRTPTVADLADELGATPEDILEALDAAQAYRAASLDCPSPAGLTLSERTGTADDGMEKAENLLVLRAGLARLPERLRTIVTLRFSVGLSQNEIAARVGVSQMHVSRLLQKALDLLRGYVADAPPESAPPEPSIRRRQRPARTSAPVAVCPARPADEPSPLPSGSSTMSGPPARPARVCTHRARPPSYGRRRHPGAAIRRPSPCARPHRVHNEQRRAAGRIRPPPDIRTVIQFRRRPCSSLPVRRDRD